MNYRTQVIIPVLAVLAEDGMGGGGGQFMLRRSRHKNLEEVSADL